MATLLVLCRFLHFCVVLLMFGAWVFRPWLLGAHVVQPTLDRQLLRITRGLAGLGLFTGVVWLLLITASMAGSWDSALQPATVQLVLGKTFFGQVWTWHLLFNLLLVLVLILRHAQNHRLKPILRRFSGVGYGLVAGLLVTGLINVRVLTGQLWPTPLFQGFALILLIKVGLVLGMLGLALLNRLRIKRCEQRLGSLRASVMMEWLLGLAAVAAVSLLGTLPPMVMAG